MKKYDFGVEFKNPVNGLTEKMTITGCDSFDEAIRLMEKALKDRQVQIENSKPAAKVVTPPAPATPEPTHMAPPASTSAPSTTPGPTTSNQQPA